jgi:hypothetical protein
MDSRAREIYHGIAEVESCVRREDSCAEGVAGYEFHDTGDELADSAEEHDDTDEDVGSLDATSVHTEERDEKDTRGEGQET